MNNHELEKLLKELGTERFPPPGELVEAVEEQLSENLVAAPLLGSALVVNLFGYIFFLTVFFSPKSSLLWRCFSLEVIFLVTNICLIALFLIRDKLTVSSPIKPDILSVNIKKRRKK